MRYYVVVHIEGNWYTGYHYSDKELNLDDIIEIFGSDENCNKSWVTGKVTDILQAVLV